MPSSLLIYKNGRFSIPDPVPDWYKKMRASDEDWETAINNAGFRKKMPPLKFDQNLDGIDVFLNEDQNIFYAECWATEEEIWAATFAWEDWPLFYSQFVLPSRQEQTFDRLESIHHEIVEYLVRNEPGNPEAARRDAALEAARRRRAESRRSE